MKTNRHLALPPPGAQLLPLPPLPLQLHVEGVVEPPQLLQLAVQLADLGVRVEVVQVGVGRGGVGEGRGAPAPRHRGHRGGRAGALQLPHHLRQREEVVKLVEEVVEMEVGGDDGLTVLSLSMSMSLSSSSPTFSPGTWGEAT